MVRGGNQYTSVETTPRELLPSRCGMNFLNPGLLAQANTDNSAGGVVVILICIGLCWAMNQKPPTKTETWAGQKTTEYGP